MNISIIDYGMGNINSVANSLKRINCNVKITSDIGDIKSADGLILPGVGAFGKAIENLKKLKLFDVLKELVLNEKKPILGICLGMQLFADVSYERGKFDGLGFIPGSINKIIVDKYKLLLPHVGWNSVKIKKNKPLYYDIEDQSSFYFVHSFYFDCDSKFKSGNAKYGKLITASIQKDNIFGVQFHPEKSQTNGLILLNNFKKEINILKSKNG